MQSVGRAYGILRNRQTGSKEEAVQFLQSLTPAERVLRNRSEGRNKHRSLGFKYKPGRKRR